MRESSPPNRTPFIEPIPMEYEKIKKKKGFHFFFLRVNEKAFIVIERVIVQTITILLLNNYA